MGKDLREKSVKLKFFIRVFQCSATFRKYESELFSYFGYTTFCNMGNVLSVFSVAQ